MAWHRQWAQHVAAIACLASAVASSAMDMKVVDDQIILSGAVVADDASRVAQALQEHPAVTTVILRNSRGGDVPAGYAVGNLLREKRLTTAVSGYCNSSCSRMFMGGVRRLYTDDYPADVTRIGFHGHYDSQGKLNARRVDQLGLKDWIVRHSDGKADGDLVDRWIRIPVNNGFANFYNPAKFERNGISTFMCQGTEERPGRPFTCEAIPKTAIDLGVATSTETISSRDRARASPR